jgi:hypothetical protein
MHMGGKYQAHGMTNSGESKRSIASSMIEMLLF